MFIQVIQARCSRPEELREFSKSWKADLGPGASGWLGGTFGVTEDGDFLAVVRFESKEAAAANSARPEQGAWAEKIGTYLDGPPTFSDYDDVTLLLDGGSDDAGFVQVIRGNASDPDRAKALMAGSDELRRMRPEIIGGTFALAPDGSFTQTVAFTDEASARSGEQLEPPAEVREGLEGMLSGATFYDLRDPWFESAD
jgi:hypothetical protein